jgi:hypothetical protein
MIFPFEFDRLPAPGPTQDNRPNANRAILVLFAAGFVLLLYFLLRSKKSVGLPRSSASLPTERWKHGRPTDYE